jgi:hypothetical protein
MHILALETEYHETQGTGGCVRLLERGVKAADTIVNEGFIRCVVLPLCRSCTSSLTRACACA